ncbi:MAG: ABC transporter ATP-binding protein [Spirochaetaceae bacterium]|nr:MAG: ABC transporter ATP-binding protein [Spirochaetaceae bacterium]
METETRRSAHSVLRFENLSVRFSGRRSVVTVVRGVDLVLRPASVHALVGESGAGKTVSAKAVLGLLPRSAETGGRILYHDADLLSLSDRSLRAIRGKRITMVFQQPDKHLNPSMRIGAQVAEVLRYHNGLGRHEALLEARGLLDMVELNGREVLRAFPHELSGGMKQRVAIASAIACRPEVLIADEPTTALDASIQAQILALLDRVRHELGTAILFISHDLPLVRGFADDVSVLYAGRIVEQAASRELFECASHPYTDRLIAATPDPARRGQRLAAIPGGVPDPEEMPAGCAFAPRCPMATDLCRRELPLLRVPAGTLQRLSACHFAEDVACGSLADG